MVSQAATESTVTTVAERLRTLRAEMKDRGIDAIIVRATDAYLNEYVPADVSLRAWISGFTGSMGDVVITGDRAVLFVDGRYTLQAGKEAPDFEVRQIGLGQPIESGWLDMVDELADQGVTSLGVETDRVPVALHMKLEALTSHLPIELEPTVPSLVEIVRGKAEKKKAKRKGKVWPVDRELTGSSVKDRLAAAQPKLDDEEVDGFLVVPLDEIAWLCDLRGDHFPYQATFRAQAVALGDEVLVAANEKALKKDTVVPDGVRFVGEGGLPKALSALVKERGSLALGFSQVHTPEALCAELEEAGCVLVGMDSPFAKTRTFKTEQELLHMTSSFARADEVVKKLQTWVNGQLAKEQDITEADVAKKVEQLFKRSGAWGLSFAIIPAFAANGAVIHYSQPDDQKALHEGELFLLDTGGYYDGGYATDLTRTFLLGRKAEATEQQQHLFTSVLRSAIAGMCARFPKGTTGEQLDAIVRAPMWAAGLNYAHGTGHGVGVNVHEFPPRLMPGVRFEIEPGQVFSIEPGVYLEGWGGVRIENLVVCIEDPDDKDFLRIRPLTFSPLDKRLIDRKRLSAHEKAFLTWFAEGAKMDAHERLSRPLPPLL
jgi:Xaa-Pro aminopeptidase